MIRRVVMQGRLLPLLSVLMMVGSVVAWGFDWYWLPFAIGAIYLIILQVALEKTGW